MMKARHFQAVLLLFVLTALIALPGAAHGFGCSFESQIDHIGGDCYDVRFRWDWDAVEQAQYYAVLCAIPFEWSEPWPFVYGTLTYPPDTSAIIDYTDLTWSEVCDVLRAYNYRYSVVAYLPGGTPVFSDLSGDPDVPTSAMWWRGDPIDLSDGSLRLDEVDFAFNSPGGSCVFSRTYRTRLHQFENTSNPCEATCSTNRGVGKGWLFNWDTRLLLYEHEVLFVAPDAREHVFWKAGESTVTNPRYHDVLQSYDDNGTTKYTVTTLDDTVFWFDDTGRIERITDSCGRETLFTYDGGALMTVTDTAGREYHLDYSAAGNVEHIFVERSGDNPAEWDEDDLTLVTLSYDAADPNLLVQATNAAGETTTYGYDDHGGQYVSMATCTSHEGRVTYYTFDGSAQRYTEVFYSNASYQGAPEDPVFLRHTFEYDFVFDNDSGYFQRARVTDQNGNTTAYYFRTTRGFDRIEYPDGAVVTVTYDEDEHVSTRTVIGSGEHDGYFLKSVYTWGPYSTLLTTATRKVASEDEPVTAVDLTFSYDEPSFRAYVTRIEDALGRTIHFDYDAATGNLVRLFNLDGSQAEVNTIEYAYYGPEDAAKNGLLERVTDACGNKTLLDYDARGNLTTIDREIVPDVALSYDEDLAIGAPLTIDIPGASGSREIEFTYDALNRIVSVLYPSSGGGLERISEHVAYRSSGDADAVSVKCGDETIYTRAFEYDDGGFLTHVTDQAGTADESTTEYVYDGAGNLIEHIDPAGRRLLYDYSAANRLRRITYYEDGDGDRFEELAYYPDGSLAGWTDCATTAYALEYDTANCVSRITQGANTLVEYTYCANHLLDMAQNADGTVDLDYDDYNRLCSADGPLPGAVDRVEYGRLPNGVVNQLRYTADGQARTIGYTYDALGRLTALSTSDGTLVTYAYDAVTGLCTGITRPNRTSTSFIYDELDRLLSTTTARISGDVIDAFAYHYDAYGLRDAVEAADGRRTEYAYDGLLRLRSEQQTSDEAATLYELLHTLDASGNRTGLRFDGDPGRELTFGINALNQTTGYAGTTASTVNVTGTIPSAWTIEHLFVTPNGQSAKALEAEIREALFVARNVELEESATNTLEASSTDTTQAGHTVTAALAQEIAFDPTPNVTFTHDANGNRIARQDGTGETTYAYDFLNRLVEITYPDGTATRFSYDAFGHRFKTQELDDATPRNVVSERRYVCDGFAPIVELDEADRVVRENVFGAGQAGGAGGLLFARVGDATHFYHCDGRGDVTSITDDGGNLVAFYEYTAFGRALTEAGTVANDFLFATKPRHEKSGLYDFGYRWYDPFTAQWLTRDPLHIAGGSNLYQYALGDPVNLSDPYGLCPESVALGAMTGFLDGLCDDIYTKTAMVASDDGTEEAIYYALGHLTGTVRFANGVYGVDRATGEQYTKTQQVTETALGTVQMGLSAYGMCRFGGVGMKPSPPASLSGGPKDVCVYYGYRDGERVYVGITNDIVRRQAEHGPRFTVEAITRSDLTRKQARAIEQVLIERNPHFENKINSISTKNPIYNDAVEWARRWLR